MTVKDVRHHCHWESATMSAELTVSGVSCFISWHALSDPRKLSESQSGDSAQLFMHSATDVTWSESVVSAEILTPSCRFHSIPNNQPPGLVLSFSYKFTIIICTYRQSCSVRNIRRVYPCTNWVTPPWSPKTGGGGQKSCEYLSLLFHPKTKVPMTTNPI